MKIVICEDEPTTRANNQLVVTEACQQLKIVPEFYLFENSEQCLFSLPDIGPVALIILDIQMAELNGMALAKKIRQDDQEVALLFVSNYDDYVFDGYDVNALGYVMKPLSQAKMVSVIEKIQKQTNQKQAFIVIEVERQAIKIYLYDLVYLESQGHYVKLVCQKQEYLTKMSLAQLKELLPEVFVQIHRSYLVNLNYISAIHKTDIILNSRVELPLSRQQKVKVKALFLAHYRGIAHE